MHFNSSSPLASICTKITLRHPKVTTQLFSKIYIPPPSTHSTSTISYYWLSLYIYMPLYPIQVGFILFFCWLNHIEPPSLWFKSQNMATSIPMFFGIYPMFKFPHPKKHPAPSPPIALPSHPDAWRLERCQCPHWSPHRSLRLSGWGARRRPRHRCHPTWRMDKGLDTLWNQYKIPSGKV